MSIPASTRRKYISNFLAIVLAVTGLQAIAISSAATASALTWTNVTSPTGRSTDWQHVRTNDDGSVIGVVSQGASQSNFGDLYLSRDSGASWTYTSQPTNNYYGLYRLAISGNGNIAIAADDSYIVKASYSGSAWSYSTRTWSDRGSGTNQRCAGYGPNFNSIAASTDGSKWVAGARDEGCVYTSDNSGADWSNTNTNISGTVLGSSISANGTTRVISTSNGNIYKKVESGWEAITSSGLPASTSWSSIACDLTCTKMAVLGPKIYTTSNSGANWGAGGSAERAYKDLSMSLDGSVLAVTDGGDVYISKDLGENWVGQGLVGGKTWTSVVVSGDGKKIYAAANDGTIRTANNLATQTITFNDPLDMTFGAADQAITATSSSGLTVTLASSTTSVCTIVSNSIRIVTAGTCTITANQAGDSLYAAAAQVANNVTISKASSSISASGITTFTYSGLPQGPSSSTVSGSAGAVTYSYVGVAPTSYSASATKPTNAGSYSVTATVATDTNYLSASSAPYTFTITQGGQTSALTVSSTIATYGSALSLTTTGGDGSGSISFLVDSGPCTVSGSTLFSTDAGTCMVTATKAASGNYLAASSPSTEITVNKATPTISLALPSSATTATYGTAVTITATISKPGRVTFKSGGTAITGCTSVSGSTTAICNWTPTAFNASTSLTADFAPLLSTKFENLTAAGSLTINVGKAELGITASSHTVAFGDAIPTVTPIYSGFVNGDTSSVVTAPICSTTYTTTTAVGSATSSCSGATATNYSFTYTSGVITITQGGQTNALTINSTSGTYGSILSLTTLGGNGGGSNSFLVNSGPCTVSGTTLTAAAVGTCMVTATKAANGNYLEASSVSTAITINPKGLTVSGLTGVNKEFDRSLTGTVTGTPTLVGVVGSDDVLLGGTPTFTFASANVGSGITVTALGYTLTGTTASNYTLTQPTVTANITAKAARVAATNTTVAFGAPVTSGVTATGLISPDAVSSASYTYTGTGTSTPPTAVGVYTVTPSNAVLSTGIIGNYTIAYDTATVTILAKYTITYNANGGQVSGGSTSSVDFVVGDNALSLPVPTRANYTFIGWHTLQTNGVLVTGAYTPTATAELWAHWVQNSLYGIGTNTKILTITTLSGVGNTYSASAGGGTIAIEYLADALPAGTVIDAYVLSDTSTATTLIGAGNDYVMSLVLAWVATDGTVPTTATGKAISMTITNSSIKRGSKIYSVIGTTTSLLGTAAADGSAIISITDDPQIIIAITKPDAPTGVSATSGGNASTTVSWTAPSDGGSAITSYTATSNAGQTCSSSTTSCSITGLTNGTAYTFTVTATNSIGISDPSAPSSAITPVAPAAPVVAPQNSGGGGGGGGGGGYVAPTPEPAPTVDPEVAAAAAAAAKALAEKIAAEEKAVAEAKAAADAKALADKKAAEEAELLATLKALQEKADAEALAAAKRVQEELAAAQLKADEALAAAAALKLAEEQRIAAALAESKKITTVYSTSAAFKLNKTYTKRLNTNTKKIAAGSTVTCIGYAKSSKNTSYAKAKVVATKQAKALCSSMKKINPTLITKSIVYPASKAPKTTVNKKWIPVSYRVAGAID
jgi:hypothetical protein